MISARKKGKEIKLFGTGASPGIAIGRIFIIGFDTLTVATHRIAAHQVAAEKARLAQALEIAQNELQSLHDITLNQLGEASALIFQVQKMMLEDEAVTSEAMALIGDQKMNASRAIFDVLEKFEANFAASANEYFRARSLDVQDLKKRIVRLIQGDETEQIAHLKEPAVVFARELSPSDVMHLERRNILGLAMDLGAQTSHTAIMARALRVPSVVGLHQAGKILQNGNTVVLNGTDGTLIIHPNRETLAKFNKRARQYQSLADRLERIRELPARTRDGKDIELAANIEFREEAMELQQYGGRGIGLFRTEYIYLSQRELPTEEQQVDQLREILQITKDEPVIVRTFDLGGDKLPLNISLPKENNPFLGLRGFRLYQKELQPLFKTQLRAMVRASHFGNLRIMCPMISCVEEMQYCREMVSQVMQELRSEGHPFTEEIPLGAMIEIPSAAVMADRIAMECDFLSIGTNDLIQYTFAVDRGNEHVAYLYQPFDPAILRMIRDIIFKGHQCGVWVGMCGEMAGDELATMLLIGLGLDEFSISPVLIPRIKEIIRHVDVEECQNLAERVLTFNTSAKVREYLKSVTAKKFRHLMLAFA